MPGAAGGDSAPMSGVARRLFGFLVGLDEGVNALGGGEPRETLSGSIGRAAIAGKWWAVHLAQPAVNTLMRNPQHCQKAAADEALRRAQEGST